MPIDSFFDYTDPDSPKFTVRNLKLDDNTVKAIACFIPFLVDIVEVEFRNNQLTDHVASAVIVGCFANPSVSRLTIAYNYLRASFSKTFTALARL